MIPRRFYGWRITWALAVTQTVGYGVLYYAFSVFIRPMETELGWSRAETSGAFSLALLLSGIAAVPVGYWLDRRGARGLMTAGSVAGVLLVLAWSYVEELRAFYAVQAGIGLVMAVVFYEVAFTVVAVWFRRDRARAMLVLTMVAGLASTIFIPLASWLVAVLPWRDALRVLALVLAVGTIPLHALVLRRRPQDLGL
ncbi:MAG: MFS transporter [Trueperaceae bacterium]|nr:MAG: MFS transporter [Trueperaceae bacterium]